ncbi:MAG TPA: hypothetical protein VGY99_32820 [Candidatus Binataceae bacterium]|nr:hypothetical protein [Candidatus Binataceae bacterium]
MARRNLQFDPGELPNSYNSGGALVSGGVIVSDGPARLYKLTVTSQDNADQFVMLFDAVAVPANGAAAVAAFKVPAGSTAGIDYGWRGKAFEHGICWSNSTTLPDLTAGAANCYAEANWH